MENPSLQKALENLGRFDELPPPEQDLLIDALRDYECWQPLSRLVREQTKKENRETLIRFYTLMAQIQYKYLEDAYSCADTCQNLVEQANLTYEEFKLQILPVIIEAEDFPLEGIILQTIYKTFSLKSDTIAVLEKLCFIYEKKAHDETLLSRFYYELRRLDPTNPKALKYFKSLYTQNGDWENVIKILELLFKDSKHQQESFRLAQEMAAVSLYQLDQPEMAINLIKTHCQGSPLDTSMILYDAFYQMGQLESCCAVLESCAKALTKEREIAVIQLKLGAMREQMRQYGLAFKYYAEALNYDDSLIEAMEGAIHVKLKEEDWNGALYWLRRLSTKLGHLELAGQLQEGILRLDQCIRTTVKG